MEAYKYYGRQISKNIYQGLPILTADYLLHQVRLKKSVYSKRFGVKPAAWIVNMNFQLVHTMLENGEIFHTIKLK